MVVTLKKDDGGKNLPRRIESTIDADGNAQENASVYVTFTRPGEGTMPEQEITKQVTFKPSAELKALLESESLSAINAELAK
jgi:hypothetical protein